MGKIKAIPADNYMFVTCNEVVTNSGIILSATAAIDDEQIVLKVGPAVRTYKPGDTVKIDFTPFIVRNFDEEKSVTEVIMKKTPKVALPVFEVDGVRVMKVPDRYIMWYYPKEETTTTNKI